MRTGSDLLGRIYFGDLVTEIHYFSPLNDILAHNSEKLLNVRLGTKCKLKQTEKKIKVEANCKVSVHVSTLDMFTCQI